MSTIPGFSNILFYHKRVRVHVLFAAAITLLGCLASASQAGATGLIISWKPGVARSAAQGPHKYIQTMQVSPTEVGSEIARLQADPRIAHIEIDNPTKLAWAPNDPMWSSQSQMPMIGSSRAWTYGLGAPITVAIIDSGIDATHPDLKNNLWVNPGEIAGNKKDDDHNGYVDDINGASFLPKDSSITDGAGHGTHVAGIIGAGLNNRVGVAGIAANSRIMTLRTFDSNGMGGLDSYTAQAIDYAWQNGAKIINASFGCNGKYACYSDAVLAAIGRARDHGVLVVAAAGNNNGVNNDQTPFYPASYNQDNILSVASVDPSGSLSSFSNLGASSVDLAAPGNSIFSTTPKGTYGYKSGTSMSTPTVVGVAAWLWGMKPDATYQDIRQALLSGTTPNSQLQGKVASGGSLDMTGALLQLLPAAQIAGDPYFGPRPTAAPKLTLAKNTVSCDTGSWSPKPSSYSYQWKRGEQVVSGQTGAKWTVSDNNFSQPISCIVTASNTDGSMASTSSQLAVPTPLMTTKPSIAGTARAGQTLSCNTGTWLYGPTQVTYSWTVDGAIALRSSDVVDPARYQLSSKDTGHKISCSVQVGNTTGTTQASSLSISIR